MKVVSVSRQDNGGIEVTFNGVCYFISKGFLDEASMNLNVSSFYYKNSGDGNVDFREMWGSQIKGIAREINQELKKVKSLPEGTIFEWVILRPKPKAGCHGEVDNVKLFNAHIVDRNGKKFLFGFQVKERILKRYSFSLSTKMVEIGPAKST